VENEGIWDRGMTVGICGYRNGRDVIGGRSLFFCGILLVVLIDFEWMEC